MYAATENEEATAISQNNFSRWVDVDSARYLNP